MATYKYMTLETKFLAIQVLEHLLDSDICATPFDGQTKGIIRAIKDLESTRVKGDSKSY